MDTVTLIRIGAAAVAVILGALILWRRNRRLSQ